MGPVLEVARREAGRYLRLLDRRSLVAALALGVALGALWPAIADEGLTPNRGLHTVAVEDGSPLAPLVDADDRFVRAGPRAAADLVLEADGGVRHDPDAERSRAALSRLSTATHTWTDRTMEAENDTAAAFPVRVAVQTTPRSLAVPATGPAPTPPDEPGDSGADGNDTANATSSDDDLGTQRADLLPSQISPPFPLESLLLTFAYLIPLTFVADLVAGSVFSERVRSRGLALLSAPVTPGRILAGKTLPYLAATVGLAAVTTVALGAGWVGFAAALPIVGFALAAAVVIGIVAPSQRALTFGLVSVNVLLGTFLFLPALFTGIQPLAFLSPVGLIAAAIRGEAIGAGSLAYGTAPLWAITAALAALAVAMYREETLSSPGGALPRIVDGLARLVRRRRGLLAAGLLAVPPALALELFVLVFAVTLDVELAFVAFLVGGALVEELLKAAPCYAAYAREGPARAWAPALVGGLVGLGFFLGEKAAFGLGLAGFGGLPGGRAALATYGVAPSLALALAPLALHATATTLAAWASRRGRLQGVAGWLGAGALHAAYNGAVILLVADGGVGL